MFQDYNRNGIQDPNEPGISGIPLQLYQQGVLRGQTTTDANGRYRFDDTNVTGGLLPNTPYEIRVAATSFPAGFTLTRRNQGADPELDSDARLIGGQAVITLTTGAANTTTNSYDIGLAAGNPDVTVAVASTPANVSLGTNATFTIQASNLGNAPAEGVVVRDTLDALRIVVARGNHYVGRGGRNRTDLESGNDCQRGCTNDAVGNGNGADDRRSFFVGGRYHYVNNRNQYP